MYLQARQVELNVGRNAQIERDLNERIRPDEVLIDLPSTALESGE